MWQRDDRADWSQEIVNAHAAFARGKHCGLTWAQGVSKFMDFEVSHEFGDDGAMMTALGRPREVSRWIGRARPWDRVPDIGVIETRGTKSTYAAVWWDYWISVQPSDRLLIGGMLTAPTEADWESLGRKFGKNGLLQVMLTLLWWGDVVRDAADEAVYQEWESAVRDVTWVLGEIEKAAALKEGEG